MRVLAISDLHLDFAENVAALQALPPHRQDWLILAGDIGHSERHLTLALDLLSERFARLIWVPGNHDLWTVPPSPLRGEAKYRRLVEICRDRGVTTPEDQFPTLSFDDQVYTLAPLLLLYDYSFRPPDVSREMAIRWAAEEDISCTDELYLDSAPHPSVTEWCAERCRDAEARLATTPSDHRLVLINHFPLREDLIWISIPRFRIWCGTQRTARWHTDYNVAVVVSGHLHVPTTTVLDGVRFEEVSLGYPRQWNHDLGLEDHLRQILPQRPVTPKGVYFWRLNRVLFEGEGDRGRE